MTKSRVIALRIDWKLRLFKCNSEEEAITMFWNNNFLYAFYSYENTRTD